MVVTKPIRMSNFNTFYKSSEVHLPFNSYANGLYAFSSPTIHVFSINANYLMNLKTDFFGECELYMLIQRRKLL